MTERKFWLDLFSGKSWGEFNKAGARISGFKNNKWTTLQKVDVGDYLLCYMTGISRFIGVLEVTSKAYRDTTPIWEDDPFPCRVNVKPIFSLTPETAIPVMNLSSKLSFFQNLTSEHSWTGHFRGSLSLWKQEDGDAILQALKDASSNPVILAVDPKKLARRPQGLLPRRKRSPTQETIAIAYTPEPRMNAIHEIDILEKPNDIRKHTEIQYLLLELGSEMGFSVWAARNDRNRTYQGNSFGELFKIKEKLPLQFDERTTKTIELIDVLWLKGNAIVAAFEVESTTSIYSGLLRMSDLIAMQPNLNIPLYLVAPDERREKVKDEINRPTFARLNPPLSRICRYISFENLKLKLDQVQSIVRYLKPEFLHELSEDCQRD